MKFHQDINSTVKQDEHCVVVPLGTSLNEIKIEQSRAPRLITYEFNSSRVLAEDGLF